MNDFHSSITINHQHAQQPTTRSLFKLPAVSSSVVMRLNCEQNAMSSLRIQRVTVKCVQPQARVYTHTPAVLLLKR